MKHARPDYDRIQDPLKLIPADEPVFLIRGQDISSAEAVLAWANLNDLNKGDPEASRLARAHAQEMRRWVKKKPADLERPEETIVRLAAEVERWKRRAAKHGCDVEKGDEDCG